jgi:hypothetical protein
MVALRLTKATLDVLALPDAAAIVLFFATTAFLSYRWRSAETSTD